MSSLLVRAARGEQRFTPRLRRMDESEIGRPHGKMRLKNIVQGQMDARVQPLYDIIQVAVATATVQQTLFTIPFGQQFTPTGGAATTKTLYHTNLLNSGSLDAPKKLLVKNIALVGRPDMFAPDVNALGGQFVLQFTTLGKQFTVAHGQKFPAGSGTFASGVGSLTAPSALMSSANGWPSAQNTAPITDAVPDIPGYPPITPITGVLLEQGQPFQIILDPTLTGAAVYTTQAAGAIGNAAAVGIIAWVYLEGITLVAIV